MSHDPAVSRRLVTDAAKTAPAPCFILGSAAVHGQETTTAARGRSECVSLGPMMRQLLFVQIAIAVSLSSLHAQPASPATPLARPQAIYTPMPIYRPEWAKQGLTGKGVVLVTIDKETGKVTGARMLESTGNQLLDGAALQAYSQWRFKPGSVTQLKMPIEFKKRPPTPTSTKKVPPAIVSVLLILLGFAAAMMLARRRRK